MISFQLMIMTLSLLGFVWVNDISVKMPIKFLAELFFTSQYRFSV